MAEFMKTTNWMMMFLLAGVLTLAGCGKEVKPAASVADGVTVDMPTLRQVVAEVRIDRRITSGFQYVAGRTT